MEPSLPPCLGGGACENLDGTRSQGWTRSVTSPQIAGVPQEKVIIHTPFLGGGFGGARRSPPTRSPKAVHVAKAAGVPVKNRVTRRTTSARLLPAALCAPHRGRSRRKGPAAGVKHNRRQSIQLGGAFEKYTIIDGIDAIRRGVVDSTRKAVPDRKICTARNRCRCSGGVPVGNSHTAPFANGP